MGRDHEVVRVKSKRGEEGEVEEGGDIHKHAYRASCMVFKICSGDVL